MIDPQRKTIEDILDRSAIYAVPHYQRAFEWSRDNALDFWEDLTSGDFFLGTLIFDISDKESIAIVDGQQRLTTIFILLSALRSRAKEIGEEAQARAIQELIAFKDNRTGEYKDSKFISSDKIRDAFELTITNFEWDGMSFEVKNRKRQVNKIRPLYDFFYGRVKNYSKSEIKDTLNQLYDSFSVVIEIEKTEEAFDIFERTNARGVDLNAADLLKNYLFSKLDLSNEQIKKTWDEIVERASGNSLRMIKHFYVSKEGYVKKSELFRRLRTRGGSVGPEKLFEEIDAFSKHYNLIIDSSKQGVVEWASEFNLDDFRNEFNAQALNKSLEGIRLFQVTQVYPLLAKIFEEVSNISNKDKRKSACKSLLKFVKALENFHFVNSAVGQKQANIVEMFYADKCKDALSGETVVTFMKQIIENLLDSKLIRSEEFVASFSNINYENDFTLIYYINDRLNDFYLTKTNQSNIYNPDKKILRRNHSIDHLLAQSKNNYGYDIDDEYMHSIGNLLVIDSILNSSLGDVHIDEKIATLKDETTTLPEIKQLLGEWGDADWVSKDVAEENIKLRSERMAKQSYDEVFAVKM